MINLIIGIILLILAIILYLAILEIRDDTKRTKELIYHLVKWTLDKDKSKWIEFKQDDICHECGSALYNDSDYCPECSTKVRFK